MLAIRKGSATKGVAMYEIEEPEVPEGWALVKVLKLQYAELMFIFTSGMNGHKNV